MVKSKEFKKVKVYGNPFYLVIPSKDYLPIPDWRQYAR